MGDRANILIEDIGVVLYLHWTAEKVEEQVKTALRKRRRWFDPIGLARMVFNETTKDLKDDVLHAGIYAAKNIDDCWDGHINIIINCKKRTITVIDNYEKTIKLYSFNVYIFDSIHSYPPYIDYYDRFADEELIKEFPAKSLSITREELIDCCEGFDDPETVKMLIEKMSDGDIEAISYTATCSVHEAFWNDVTTSLGLSLATYQESLD